MRGLIRGLIVISAVCIQLSSSHGYPGGPQGVGAYAYQDSSGNRYGGTYELKDGMVVHSTNKDGASLIANTNKDLNFVPLEVNSFQDVNEFFPEYFRKFENILKEAFQHHFEHQQIALNAARKAFDLTSNQAGYIPNFAPRFPSFGSFPGFNNFAVPAFDMSDFGNRNSAFAGAAAGPGFSHQMAAINPMNMQIPNVDVTSFADAAEPGKPNFYSVSSSSYASSSDVNGEKQETRGAETVVNNNGKVTKYKVQN